MATSAIAQEIITRVDQLLPAQQQQVLEFVRSLALPAGRAGVEILHLAGSIDVADLEIMRQVADEECERIDLNGW